MKRFAFILLSNFILLAAYGQTVMVNGTLKDPEGSPLPGVNIIIKGTTQGTVTDIDGNYSIEAPVGAILVVSFIGFQPIEFEVANNGKAKMIKKPTPAAPRYSPPANADVKRKFYQTGWSRSESYDSTISIHDPKNGVAVMSTDMKYKIHNDNSPVNYTYLKFKGIQQQRNKQILVFENRNDRFYYKPNIFFTTSFASDNVNNLPDLQSIYAQGRPSQSELLWQGPESESIFAWGPALNQLEYDGSSYDYDKNGRLVPLFDGNGQSPQVYNPYDFFRSGMQFRNSIRIEHRIGKIEYFCAFKNNLQKGIIPLSAFNRNTFETGIQYKVKKINLTSDISFSKIKSNFSEGSTLTYHIVKSILLTPPTFDNSNGFGHDAINSEEAYITPSGEQRSAAIHAIDNPYWLLNNSTDELTGRMALGKFDLSYNLFREAQINLILTGNQQKNRQLTGIKRSSYIFPEGIFYSRAGGVWSQVTQVLIDNLKLRLHDLVLTGLFNYQYSFDAANLERNNYNSYFLLTDLNESRYRYDKKRQTQQFNAEIKANYKDIILLSAQQHRVYFSDIEKPDKFWSGSFTGGVILTNISKVRRSLDFIDYWKIYSSYGNEFKVPSLLTDAAQYTSVNLTPEELNSYFPNREIVYANSLIPENLKAFNLGMEMNFNHCQHGIAINWHRKNTLNAILPDYSTLNEIRLNNLADLRTQGVELSINTHQRYYPWEFYHELNITSYKTIVTKLYQGIESVPLAGFSFVSSNAIEGEPLGVLTGTAYQRDASGQILIGESGYPEIALQQGILGNPYPKWTASLFNRILYERFELSFLWEVRVGGKVWDGTKATLDYYGLSAETGEKRSVRNYVFEGNTPEGIPNTTQVDFANPNNNFQDNRWVRYGVCGVAEEYIEDGSWFRLRSLKSCYTIDHFSINAIKKIKITLFANNIILLQKYSGVDPESALFGQPGGMGIDYFNMPSTRSYGISLELNL